MEEAQLINYLKASGLKVGLLINFSSRSLEHKRFVYKERGRNNFPNYASQLQAIFARS
ncbi:MAG: GxxExxY protein [Deltaproteobacteria bacterium]|nr:GxxExxY protein [Deltaproteobacteria bacterium]